MTCSTPHSNATTRTAFRHDAGRIAGLSVLVGLLLASSASPGVAHQGIAQRAVAQRGMAHHGVLHRKFASRGMAHHGVLLRKLTHRGMAHRSLPHRSPAHRASMQEVPAGSEGPLSELSFMVGCWRGPAYGGEGVVEERFTPPLGDTMLGTTRYVRGRKVEMFEFHRIHVGEEGVELVPYPRGRESSPFRLVVAAAGRAVFENPDNDFPVRIIYRIHDGDTLVARIEGEDGNGAEWSMRRCGTDGS